MFHTLPPTISYTLRGYFVNRGVYEFFYETYFFCEGALVYEKRRTPKRVFAFFGGKNGILPTPPKGGNPLGNLCPSKIVRQMTAEQWVLTLILTTKKRTP